MTRHRAAVVADEGFDPFAHINPRSRTFYKDCTTAAAYLINGEGHWLSSGRCMLTAAIMHQAILAARENRPCSLHEVHSIITNAGRKIRRRAHDHSHQETQT